MENRCEQCLNWTWAPPFCNVCLGPMGTRAMDAGHSERDRRDRAGVAPPETWQHAVAEGRRLFAQLYLSRDAVDYLATLYATGLGAQPTGPAIR